MGKVKDKKDKFKSVQERIEIAEDLKKKIREHGISEEFEAIDTFFKILDEYCKPNVLSGFSGNIPFIEAKRTIEYVLPLRKTAQAYANLKVTQF